MAPFNLSPVALYRSCFLYQAYTVRILDILPGESSGNHKIIFHLYNDECYCIYIR